MDWNLPKSNPVVKIHQQSTGPCGAYGPWCVRTCRPQFDAIPDSKVHGAHMGPIWGREDPGGPHVGPMNFAIWDVIKHYFYITLPDYTKFALVTITIMVWVLKLILACYVYKSMPMWYTINHNKTQPWWPLLGILSWYPIFKSSHCHSFEDQAPVNFIYGCLIFK